MCRPGQSPEPLEGCTSSLLNLTITLGSGELGLAPEFPRQHDFGNPASKC